MLCVFFFCVCFVVWFCIFVWSVIDFLCGLCFYFCVAGLLYLSLHLRHLLNRFGHIHHFGLCCAVTFCFCCAVVCCILLRFLLCCSLCCTRARGVLVVFLCCARARGVLVVCLCCALDRTVLVVCLCCGRARGMLVVCSCS